MMMKDNKEIKKKKLTRTEMETTINYNDLSDNADIYTHNPALIRKLNICCEKHPESFKMIKYDAEFGSYCYVVPKKYIKVNAPRKGMTEEQKEAVSERFKKLREAEDNML